MSAKLYIYLELSYYREPSPHFEMTETLSRGLHNQKKKKWGNAMVVGTEDGLYYVVVRGHGCVNMSERYARRLVEWYHMGRHWRNYSIGD